MFLKRLDRTKKNIPGLRYEMTGPPALDTPKLPAHPARDETPVSVSKTCQFFHLPSPPPQNYFHSAAIWRFVLFFLQAEWFISPTVCLTSWLWCMDMYCFWFNYIHPHFIHEANLVQAHISEQPVMFTFFFLFCFFHVGDEEIAENAGLLHTRVGTFNSWHR